MFGRLGVSLLPAAAFALLAADASGASADASGSVLQRALYLEFRLNE